MQQMRCLIEKVNADVHVPPIWLLSAFGYLSWLDRQVDYAPISDGYLQVR